MRRSSGRRWPRLGLVIVWATLGCATALPGALDGPRSVLRPFVFERDTLAFANELYWDYRFDDVTGARETHPRDGPIRFGNRCVPMARAIRQFRNAARFDPDALPLADDAYRERVRRVLATDPRSEIPAADPVVIPGYAGLRAFSRDHAQLLQEELGGRAESFLQRGNLRMVFPFLPSQQRDTARALVEALGAGELPIVHLVVFPTTELNHTVVVFAAEETAREVRYQTFDPNDPDEPVPLVFERAPARFHYPRTRYFAGGVVHAYEIYRGLF